MSVQRGRIAYRGGSPLVPLRELPRSGGEVRSVELGSLARLPLLFFKNTCSIRSIYFVNDFGSR